jgi:hypothetical protein
MAKSERRFIDAPGSKFGLISGGKIIIDRETGVNYLFYASGNAAGLTVLYDKDGKPLVMPYATEY